VKQSREEMLNTKLRYRQKRRKELALKQKIYYRANKESDAIYKINYRKKNRLKLRAWFREYMRERYKNDPIFRANCACRNALKRVLKATKNSKKWSTEQTLGYDFKEFKRYIEEQFEPWMSWSNHGKWHVDHIKPLSLFIKEGVTDPKIINALSNLQPLKAIDNMVKGCNYE